LTSETDNVFGPNEFGLQLNSQFFPGVNTTYTDYKSAYAFSWEQFVFINDPSGTYGTQIFIQYWLANYYSTYGSCPSMPPPGGNGWYEFSSDCYANSPSNPVPTQTASDLANLILTGYANTGSNDEDRLCISGGGCYDVAITDQVVNLYQYWKQSEFNIFGLGSGSEAIFNPGTTITVTNTLEDQGGNVIVPSCASLSYTGETNNLNLGSCSSNSGGSIVFAEGLRALVTLSVLQGFTGDSTGSILLVTGDITINPHGSKPPGVGYQAGRDTTPLGFVSGMLSNTQQYSFDTNTNYVDSSGRPIGSWSLVVSVGGPLSNAVTHYYETTSTVADRAPLTISLVGSNWVWTTWNGTQVASVPASSVAVPPGTSDVAYIQILNDSSGRLVLLFGGTSYLGSWAGAWYFKNVIYPNISSYTNNYIIFRWTDASSGSSADYIPDQGDTFTVLAQGTA
jgi:hypothetical protein